ncbi:MAG: adenylosuccinate synthase [Candidatus Micrarchaeia archaeon]
MTGVVVVGAQWGDEGKGKIVDYYAERAHVVVRFNGGSNAGHTVVVGGHEHKFHIMPSGAIRGKRVVIGNGVVVDPKLLLEVEIGKLREEGIEPNLLISERAHVVLPFHKQLDGIEEKLKGKWRAGTTMRGIGPTYSDKAARLGIRMGELVDREVFKEKLGALYEIKKRVLAAYGESMAASEEDIFQEYAAIGEKLKKYVGDAGAEVCGALARGRRVLFEGAQGTMLDIDHGLYPFGTSSNTTAGGACTGAGVPPTAIDEVVGVAKAYLSRVGEGPVPTELTDETGEWIRRKGVEFGTTTGRPRRCGWLDIVTLRYAARVNGLTGLAIMKLDVLGGLEKIKICTAYELDGKRVGSAPSSPREFAKCRPVYEELPGWKDLPHEEWKRLARKGFNALPAELRAYVKRVARLVRVPLYAISVGRDRSATIEFKNPLE